MVYFEKLLTSRWLYILFFLTAGIIFSPFFLHLDVIVSSTDTVFNHFPNIIYGYRAMRQGHFPLWNPYIFLGQDFTVSMHNHMLNPANWILLLFSENEILRGLTFIAYCQISLIGVIAFKIFNCFIEDRLASLLPSIVTQLSSFTWFTTTTFIGIELFFLSIVFIYLIASYKNRGCFFNFILMSLCSFFVFAVGHVGYIIAYLLPVMIFAFVLNKNNFLTPWKGALATIAVSVLTGLILAFYRLIPILTHAPQKPWLLSLMGDNAYFLLPGLIPGLLGYSISDSSQYFMALGVSGRHIQFHNFLYYGMLVIFMTILALANNFGTKGKMIAIAIVCLICMQIFLIQPIADITAIVLYPFIYDIVPRVMTSFLLFSLTGICAYCLSKGDYRFNETSLRMLIVFIGFILCMSIIFNIKVAYAIHEEIHHWSLWFWPSFVMSKVLILLVILGTAWLSCRTSLSINLFQRITNASFLLFVLIVSTICYFKHVTLSSNHFFIKICFFYAGSILWAWITLRTLRNIIIPRGATHAIMNVILSTACLAILIAVPINSLNDIPHATFLLRIIALLNFIVIAALSFEIILSLYKQVISHRQFLFIATLLLFGELLFAMKIYNYAGGPPFLDNKTLYPSIATPLPTMFNLKHYRVTHPGGYLSSVPWAGTDPFSNIFMIYNLRSYAGVDSFFNNELFDYISYFVPGTSPFIGRVGISPAIDNERLLDLIGVKYNLASPFHHVLRPRALARLSLFSSFKMIPSITDQNKLLANHQFSFDKTVLIDRQPTYKITSYQKTFIPIDYIESSSNHLRAEISTPDPAIILFNDSYSSDWKAFWNHHELPVMKANGYFMAIAKPPGQGNLEFVFHPTLFLHLATFSMYGISFMLIFLVVLSSMSFIIKRNNAIRSG